MARSRPNHLRKPGSVMGTEPGERPRHRMNDAMSSEQVGCEGRKHGLRTEIRYRESVKATWVQTYPLEGVPQKNAENFVNPRGCDLRQE